MDNSRRQSGYSPSSPFQLPPLSSMAGNIGPRSISPRDRGISAHDSSVEMIQTLRQQMSAQDQSIAILRSEQDRIQLRYEALQTKSQVMDHEVAVLMEERVELRKRADSLTIHVERLNRDKEELQNQSQADAAQWRQIMSMSSRLQLKGTEETRRFNLEREAWCRERENLEHKVAELSGGMIQQIDTTGSESSSLEPQRSSAVMSMSDDQLRREVIELRKRCSELEELLSAVVKELASIERAGVLIKEVKRRMTSVEEYRGGEGTSSRGQ